MNELPTGDHQVIRLGEETAVLVPIAEYLRLRELHLESEIARLKSELSNLRPVDQPEEYNQVFQELVDLETQRRRYAALNSPERLTGEAPAKE